MRLENTFTLDIPIGQAWAALNDPETVAPCFPGAKLTSYEAEAFEGTVKVKLGPISLTYQGTGKYVARDTTARRVIIEAKGRDSKGGGTASATVTGSMTALGDNSTQVTMVTDMNITGRPAQFGRGVISDVSEKLINQFADCLGEHLVAKGDHSGLVTVSAAPRAEEEAAGAIDLLRLGGPTVARLAPIAGVLATVAFMLVIRRMAR